MQILNRTAGAFTFSAERLAQQCQELYFWTFTFKQVPLDDETGMQDWVALHNRMKHHFPWMQGLRVVELHRSHGIHFHALINGRIPIRRLFRMIYGSGHLVGYNRKLDFGRMTVDRCDLQTISYMAKYLSKQYKKEHNFSGRRRWGTIGGFAATRCRDIEYDSPTHRNRVLAFGDAKVDYASFLMLSHYSLLWGEYADWPVDAKMKLMAFQIRKGRETKKNQGREEEPVKGKRVDLEWRLWDGHREMCGFCRWGYYSMCDRGQGLWKRMMAAEWRFDADEVEQDVTLRNTPKLGDKLQETAERPYGLQKVRDEKGGLIYILKPFSEIKERVQDPF